jgi:hypothetical protein
LSGNFFHAITEKVKKIVKNPAAGQSTGAGSARRGGMMTSNRRRRGYQAAKPQLRLPTR